MHTLGSSVIEPRAAPYTVGPNGRGCCQDLGENPGSVGSSRRPASSDCRLAGGDWEGLCYFEGEPSVAGDLIFSDSVSIKHCERLRRNRKIQLKPVSALGEWVGAWSLI